MFIVYSSRNINHHLNMDTILFRMQMSRALVLIYILSSVCCDVCRDHCQISRVQGFRSADCYRGEIIQVPQCLPRNTEILDLSFNRIREISKGDFESYSYLEILYLSDNILTEIDENALDDLTSLHTLDVSTNAFYNVPKALFSLPSLVKLYLGSIKNKRMVEDIESAVPITSPLVYLDLSQNKLPRLPILGEIPTLQFYNISGNKNVKLNISMFVGLCTLQELTNNDFTAIFENPCECQILEKWLTLKNIKFNPFNCEQIDCPTQIPEKDLDVFNSCRKLHEVQQQQLFKKKLLTNVGISVAAIVGFLLVMLLYIYRRNKRLKEKSKLEKEAHRNTQQTKEVIDNQGLL